MTITTIELPKGFSLEKLQNLAKVLDFKIIDFKEIEVDSKLVHLIEKAREEKKQGKLKPIDVNNLWESI